MTPPPPLPSLDTVRFIIHRIKGEVVTTAISGFDFEQKLKFSKIKECKVHNVENPNGIYYRGLECIEFKIVFKFLLAYISGKKY